MHQQRSESIGIINITFLILILILMWGITSDGAVLASTGNGEIFISNTNGVSETISFKENAAIQSDWAMVAANPQRTSWTTEEVYGNLNVEWYRPIEAYIPQNSQVIAANGMLYISTARGLYALDAATGALAWRYDTELPLGNSPTVDNGVVYVGGYDRKLRALDAFNGTELWSFSGATAGYDTNPLVVNGKVLIGNRDGAMYAIGAHGTSQQGQLIWKYQTGGPIHLSAAYKNGVMYFASNDMYAYALDAQTGSLVWKSQKLPGSQFQSYWPVIYQNKVIFSMAHGYRIAAKPGIETINNSNGNPTDSYGRMQLDDLFPNKQEGSTIGPPVPSQPWSHGHLMIDASRVTEYLEDNPTPDPHLHKPWRRVFVVLNTTDGSEYTFDSDQDGYPEYIPATWWGTNSGNRYPPIVGPDNVLYQGSLYSCCGDSKGIVMGWNPAAPSYLSVLGGFGAIAEPQAISGGGRLIYRNLCCDRVGDYFSIDSTGQSGTLWTYNNSLLSQAPGYNDMWNVLPGLPNYYAWYEGKLDTTNAAYHSHGDQNPIIPYQGRLFVHRGNAVIAYGAGTGPGKLPLLAINSVQNGNGTLTAAQVTSRLENEIRKMIAAGRLRPGYYNQGQFHYRWMADYFDNPGETLLTLSKAYPFLSSQSQSQLAVYLKQEFDTYFDNEMYATIGWANGAPRESGQLPPEVQSVLPNYLPAKNSISMWLTWSYPPINFYALWKYAAIFPNEAMTAYNLAKGRIQVPIPGHAWGRFNEEPYFLNAYIAGHIGFLELQKLAGMDGVDSQLRANVSNELDNLLQLRISGFTKESYTTEQSQFFRKRIDISRNFIWLVPELGDHLRQHKLTEVQAAVDEYEYIAPYWFVSRYEATQGEGVMSLLYDYNALFQAKAFVLKESPEELSKYLDVPAFERGDLFYIQNLIATLDSFGFAINAVPPSQRVEPGQSASYVIHIQRSEGFSSPIKFEAKSPSPDVEVQLSQTSVESTQNQMTITLKDRHDPSFSSPATYFVPIIATSGNKVQTVTLTLQVNGAQTYLPVIVSQG